MLFNLKLKSLTFVLLTLVTSAYSQTGIGTSTPHASAKLHVSATDKGFLPPRVTLTSATDASTIPGPAEGLLVYNLGSVGLQAGYYYWTSTSWATIATASSPDQMVDYIQASLSANQTISSVGNVIFNRSSGTGVALISGGIQLQANKTYKLEAALGGSSTGYGYYTWVDNINAILPGSSIGVIMKAGVAFTDAPQDKAVVYYTPTANTTVYLRVINISGSITAYAPSTASGFSSTWASIQQVGSSAFVNPWVLSGNNVYNTTGNVGIGTSAPNASALLDLSSTTQGVLIPRMTASQRAAIANPVAGLVVYQTNTNPGNYVFNGSSWDILSNANYGDVKTGMQIGDHNGWISLNGRLKSTLSASQQAQANLLGIGANLPNASNAFLVQNGTVLGSVSGSNTKTIVQANLPNVTFIGTAATAGSHTHGYQDVIWAENRGQNNRTIGTGAATDNDNDPYFRSATTDASGNHTHSVTVSSGGSGAVFDITPQSLSVNTFIYLGL